MKICIPNALSQKEIIEIKALSLEGKVISGEKTAGFHASKVKKNLQLSPCSPAAALIGKKVIAALNAQKVFVAFAIPKHFGPIIYARYTPGMRYGVHTDNVIMQTEDRSIRSDLSFTIWLSDPESYEGGALRLHGYDEDSEYKLNAGDLFVYPSDHLHEVTEVTKGVREVIAGWVQSRVREADIRSALFDLTTLKNTQENLSVDYSHETGAQDRALLLSAAYGKIYRHFAET